VSVCRRRGQPTVASFRGLSWLPVIHMFVFACARVCTHGYTQSKSQRKRGSVREKGRARERKRERKQGFERQKESTSIGKCRHHLSHSHVYTRTLSLLRHTNPLTATSFFSHLAQGVSHNMMIRRCRFASVATLLAALLGTLIGTHIVRSIRDSLLATHLFCK